MKKLLFILVITVTFVFSGINSSAQCSICSKNVMQMGTKPAQGFNTGIVFLMLVPFSIIGVVGYKWYRSTRP